MGLIQFKTRQEFHTKMNPVGSQYIVGIDAGYSSMKTVFEKGWFCFPSFVRKINSEMMNIYSKDDIVYTDLLTGDSYMIGTNAQKMVSIDDTNDTDVEMFSRKRYTNQSFQILCRTAVAIAMIFGEPNGRDIVIQSGLPASYVNGDYKALQKVFSTPAHFKLRVGNKSSEFSLSLAPENIFCKFPQPAGALYSILLKSDGKYVDNAKDLLFSNIMIIDGGFNTLDLYGIINRAIVCKESLNTVGMRAVLSRTAEKIMDETQEDIRLPAMQQVLENGYVVSINPDTLETEKTDITSLFTQSNEEVFEEAFSRIKGVSSLFRNYQYVILDGGTCDAWKDKFTEKLKGLKTIQVKASNENDISYPMMMSNPRGYYMMRYQISQSEHRKQV